MLASHSRIPTRMKLGDDSSTEMLMGVAASGDAQNTSNARMRCSLRNGNLIPALGREENPSH